MVTQACFPTDGGHGHRLLPHMSCSAILLRRGGRGCVGSDGTIGVARKTGFERSIWGSGYTSSLGSNLVRFFCRRHAAWHPTAPSHSVARRVRLRQFCAESVLRFDSDKMAETLPHWRISFTQALVLRLKHTPAARPSQHALRHSLATRRTATAVTYSRRRLLRRAPPPSGA